MRGDGLGRSFENTIRSCSPISVRIALLWSASRSMEYFWGIALPHAICPAYWSHARGQEFVPKQNNTKINRRGLLELTRWQERIRCAGFAGLCPSRENNHQG